MANEKQKPGKIGFPSQGIVFWPVGTGDSTTIVVDQATILQIDLNHLEGADDDDNPCMAIIDHLVTMLPKHNKRPYLALFILTHPDLDHSRGFAELLKRVDIGELWFTPRVFREYKKELCNDAKAFQAEAQRRVKKTIQLNGVVESGDRVRIIGYDELLEEDDFKDFPKAGVTVPGKTISIVDGNDRLTHFSAFVHGPFKDDCDGDRNDASLALQITLKNGNITAKGMFLGDLCYPTIKQIFTISKADTLAWQIFLAPHHCSKGVMYWKEAEEGEEQLKQDILDLIEASAQSTGYIISSSYQIPAADESGANPPHSKAAQRYREIAPTKFLCTHEHPDTTEPLPIIFTLTATGLVYTAPDAKKTAVKASLSAAAAIARGGTQPPKDQVGFGQR